MQPNFRFHSIKRHPLAIGLMMIMVMTFSMTFPLAGVTAETPDDTMAATSMEPLIIEPGYNLFFLDTRVELIEVVKGKGGNVISMLDFYLGNGVCVEPSGSIYLDMFKLLKADMAKNFELSMAVADKSPVVAFVKTGADIFINTKSGLEEKNKATVTDTQVTRTSGAMVQTVNINDTGLEWSSNMGLAMGGKRSMTKDDGKIIYKQALQKVVAETDDNLITISGLYTIEQSGNSYLINAKIGGPFSSKKFRIEFGENKVGFYQGNELKQLVIVEDNKLTYSKKDRKMTIELKYTE